MAFNLSQFAGSLLGTLIVGSVALTLGATSATQSPGQKTLDVGRINIREPDGTLRMTLSNQHLSPGLIVKGHEWAHPDRRTAGMIFFNDEGTENGGLIFDGQRDASGAAHSGGSLTFDRYEQDQVVQIYGQEDGTTRSAGIIVNEQPDPVMDFAAIDKARALAEPARTQQMVAAHAGGKQRAFLGRAPDGNSEVVLKDARGRARLRLRVSADGTAGIDFLDEAGAVQQSIGPVK